VFAQGGPPPPYDLHCPLMSLPYRLGVSLDPAQLHGAMPYLSAANDRSEHWRQRLSAHRVIAAAAVALTEAALAEATLSATTRPNR